MFIFVANTIYNFNTPHNFVITILPNKSFQIDIEK